jgi:5-methylthioadenosine/S-adenosylhomocysteine deaminase
MKTLIRGGTLVTMNANREVFTGDLRIEDERIVEIGSKLKAGDNETVLDADGCFVIPGLIQTHTHLCQVLFRGLADDLELLDWLQQKIWPMEKAHSSSSLKAAARLGILEMQSTGTTTIVDMGTTTGAGFIFEQALEAGLRYFGGNCFMDLKSMSGLLHRSFNDSLVEAEELIKVWHKKTPLLEYVVAPRFAVSCTEKMMKAGVELQKEHGLLLHTHASENRGEVEVIKKRTGLGNVDYLNQLGLLNDKAVIAHGIHLSKSEVKKFVHACAGLAHCPASNMKLASGFAAIPEYLKMGMKIGLGTDGAPCNNTHDQFLEMRFAGLVHKPKFGPRAMPAEEVFRLATLGGAEVIGRSKDLGSLEKNKLADIVVVERGSPGLATVENAYSSLVYSCSGRDVRDVFIHGREIVRNRAHFKWQAPEVISSARTELKKLLSKI